VDALSFTFFSEAGMEYRSLASSLGHEGVPRIPAIHRKYGRLIPARAWLIPIADSQLSHLARNRLSTWVLSGASLAPCSA